MCVGPMVLLTDAWSRIFHIQRGLFCVCEMEMVVTCPSRIPIKSTSASRRMEIRATTKCDQPTHIHLRPGRRKSVSYGKVETTNRSISPWRSCVVHQQILVNPSWFLVVPSRDPNTLTPYGVRCKYSHWLTAAGHTP